MKSATAAQRTLSLFTGKTDLEDPNARDGSRVEERSRSRAPRTLTWEGGVATWWTHGREHEIHLVDGGYRAFVRKRLIGIYASAIDAGRACEAER
jgi:hypothetical protein